MKNEEKIEGMKSKMRRNNRSRRGKIPQKEYTKHAIIRRTAQCLQGVEGILPKMVDEPTSALDPISTSKIEDLAMELKKVEGIACRKDHVFSVQYHPESAPGPQDSGYLFDQFIQMMEENKHGKAN